MSYVAVVFRVSRCYLIFLVSQPTFEMTPGFKPFTLLLVVVSGPAVIGHSCCGVPANVLSVCLFICLFFGEAYKIKIKISRG